MTKTCSVEGCEKGYHSRGFCKNHSRKFKRYGDPLGEKQPDRLKSEWILTNLSGVSKECVMWPFARVSAGYGAIRMDGKNEYVHTIMCTIRHGRRPSLKHYVRHLCGNGHLGCSNPQHTVWGTPSENQIDRSEHGTSNRGEMNGCARLTQKDVLSIVSDTRSQSAIAKDYGVALPTIWNIKHGSTWSWLTGISPA